MQSTARKPQFVTTTAALETDKQQSQFDNQDIRLPRKESAVRHIRVRRLLKRRKVLSVNFERSLRTELAAARNDICTFKRKANKVLKNFRKDNYAHLKPKVLEIIQRPPDDLLKRNRKRGGMTTLKKNKKSMTKQF